MLVLDMHLASSMYIHYFKYVDTLSSYRSTPLSGFILKYKGKPLRTPENLNLQPLAVGRGVLWFCPLGLF